MSSGTVDDVGLILFVSDIIYDHVVTVSSPKNTFSYASLTKVHILSLVTDNNSS